MQCFLCLCFPGFLLAVASYQFQSVDHLSLKTYLTTPLLLLFVALLSFLAVQLTGIDPFWSLTLAEKWCQRKDWIHLDTTLFAAIIRDASSLMGVYLSPSNLFCSFFYYPGICVTVEIMTRLTLFIAVNGSG